MVVTKHHVWVRKKKTNLLKEYVRFPRLNQQEAAEIKSYDKPLKLDVKRQLLARSDRVKCVDLHPSEPWMLVSLYNGNVHIWNYETQVIVKSFEVCDLPVRAVKFIPRKNWIITGSVWQLGSTSPNFTLEGHEKGGFKTRGSLKLSLLFHPEFPFYTGSEDGKKYSNKAWPEDPMSGYPEKKFWGLLLQQANLKAMVDAEIKDGERLPLVVKDMGSCEIYPQTVSHNTNGRFVVVCGDGEYIIYTAMALRNKSFGSAQEFVWALDSSEYAVRESTTSIKIFKNFKEKKTFKPEYGAEGIFGGHMLGVKSISGLAFYDWETLDLIRRIEIQPKHVYWSENGELVCIAAEDSFYILRYNAEAFTEAKQHPENISEDGIEESFDVLGTHLETVKTGLWVGDCFIYTNSLNRLNYYVGGEIVTIAHLDRVMYLLGYIPKDNRLYLGDKELNVISYSLLLSVLEYQTAVMRQDFETAQSVLPSIPWEQRTRVAHFLEKQGFKVQALAVSTDPDHKFELALQLGDLKVAYKLAKESMSEQKWKRLSELALSKCEFQLAEECLHHAKDYGGLLLLATSSGNASMVEKLAQSAELEGINNVAFMSYFLLGKKEKALNMLVQSKRLPEAAFFARTYLPSQASRIVKLWKEGFKKTNEKASYALADPEEYENLFPNFNLILKAEQFMKQSQIRLPASSYSKASSSAEKDPVEAMLEAEASGSFVYVADDDATGSQHSLSEGAGDTNSLVDNLASSYKTSKWAQSASESEEKEPAKNLLDEQKAKDEAASNQSKTAAAPELTPDEELELDLNNFVLDEDVEMTGNFDEEDMD
ncbi:Coatomer subunit beta' like protein [Argiope bruennichi]|uniref:Coatomer subunit beta' n=1 Tax=Argiope bruennichi TaxID=94029 RepID=A0A8T0FTW3_ARGBR|nr:Coatomer subunit beta' like protein [Argiope bruennichi]